MLCLATNGLGLPPHLDELAELRVSHVTLTVNAVDPEIGAKIYSWVRDGKVIYRGLAGRRSPAGAAVGVHPRPQGPGDHGQGQHHHHSRDQRPPRAGGGRQDGGAGRGHPQLHAHVSQRGYALRRRAGTAPGADDRQSAGRRRRLSPRCTTAPGAGPTPWGCWTPTAPTNSAAACRPAPARFRPPADRPYVAVATQEGVLVNLHLGEAASFQIWGTKDGGLRDAGGAPGPPARRRGGPLVDHGGNPERLPGGAGERHRRHPRRPS